MMKMQTGLRRAGAEICRRYQLHAGVDARRQGQQALLAWFNEGDTRAYKIASRTARSMCSVAGSAVSVRRDGEGSDYPHGEGHQCGPSVMAEDRSTVTATTGMTVTPARLP